MRLAYIEMIDNVDHMSVDEGIISCSCVIPDESTVFEGHFPGNPIMPGVLLTEMMAQASGYFLCYRSGIQQMAYLSGIERTRFRDFVRPGQHVKVNAKEIHQGSGYSVFNCEILANDKKVANAEIRLKLIDFANPELKNAMKNRLVNSGVVV